MPHLEKRRRVWYAILTIPKDLRALFGKRRFKQSLQTESESTAKRRVPRIISAWKAEIDAARGTPVEDDTAIFAKALRYAQTEERRATVLEEISNAADDIAYSNINYTPFSKASEVPEAVEFFSKATGQLETTTKHFEAYLDSANLAPSTVDEYRRRMKPFADSFPLLADITRKEVRTWASGLDLQKKTIQKRLGTYRTYWGYLIDIEVVPEDVADPFANLRLPHRKPELPMRQPFSSSDVRRIIDASDGKMHALIMIGAYSGARIEEICQLKVEDVHEGWFSITSSKTKAGVRDVPIHTALAPIMVKLKAKSNDGYLLSDLPPGTKIRRSATIGTYFTPLKRKLGFGPEYVFHSLRKTVATELENAGIAEGITADILGHNKSTITYGLYSGGTNMDLKREAIEKITY
jgi:integrase